MRPFLTIIFILAFQFLASSQYVISESTINWTGYGEIGNFKQTGTIRNASGELTIMEDSIYQGEIVIDLRTINHSDKQLKKHLLAKDFFNVKKYPTARFVLNTKKGCQLCGQLTIKDQTNQECFSIQIKEKENKLTVEGRLTIDRTKYGIKYNSSSYFQDLGNYAIKNEFDLDIMLLFTNSK